MPEQQQDYISALLSEFNTKLRDLEEKQRLLKERILLIGENLVSSKEESEKEITELKIKTESMLNNIEKIKETLLQISEEMDNRARKSEIDLLKKQARMFQPLEFARIEDVKKILNQRK